MKKRIAIPIVLLSSALFSSVPVPTAQAASPRDGITRSIDQAIAAVKHAMATLKSSETFPPSNERLSRAAIDYAMEEIELAMKVLKRPPETIE